MRVLSWNVGHNPEIWDAVEVLRAQEGFDVALLQEATPPLASHHTRCVAPPHPAERPWITEMSGYPRKWRTAVAWWDGVAVDAIESAPLATVAEDDERLPESCPGAFTAVR